MATIVTILKYSSINILTICPIKPKLGGGIRALSGLYPAILGRGPWPQNWEKIIDLTSKLGKIINIKYNYGSKIYPENQVILYFFMPSASV